MSTFVLWQATSGRHRLCTTYESNQTQFMYVHKDTVVSSYALW